METHSILNKYQITLIKLLLLTFLLSCSGCMSYLGKDGPYSGKIVDKETRQPLEGVVVVGNWGTAQWGSTTYYDTYETVTDKDGNFNIPGQGVQVFSDLTELQLFVLKAGYQAFEGYMWSEVKRLGIGKEEDRVVIGLKMLSLEERKKRRVHPSSGPIKKQIKYIHEINKEAVEIGRPVVYTTEGL